MGNQEVSKQSPNNHSDLLIWREKKKKRPLMGFLLQTFTKGWGISAFIYFHCTKMCMKKCKAQHANAQEGQQLLKT